MRCSKAVLAASPESLRAALTSSVTACHLRLWFVVPNIFDLCVLLCVYACVCLGVAGEGGGLVGV
jgi:hypothetical protein